MLKDREAVSAEALATHFALSIRTDII